MIFIETTNANKQVTGVLYETKYPNMFWSGLWAEYETTRRFNNVHRVRIVEKQDTADGILWVCLHDWVRPNTELAEELDKIDSAPDGATREMGML